VSYMDTLWQDVVYAARLLRKSPAFTLTAVLTLALGIGANTAVFSVVNAVMLRPLPVPHGDRLAVVAVKHPSNTELHGVSYLDLQDYRRSTHSFEDLAGYSPDLVGLRTMNGDSRPDRVVVSYVTGNYFAALGIQPAAGRLFRPDEGHVAGADPIVVLGHHFWERRFGSDPNVVGQRVTINAKPFTIVGVAPRDFTGTYAIVDI